MSTKFTIVDDVLYKCTTDRETVIIPDSVTHIKSDAFVGCESVKRLILPCDMEVVEDDALRPLVNLEFLVKALKEAPYCRLQDFVVVEVCKSGADCKDFSDIGERNEPKEASLADDYHMLRGLSERIISGERVSMEEIADKLGVDTAHIGDELERLKAKYSHKEAALMDKYKMLLGLRDRISGGERVSMEEIGDKPHMSELDEKAAGN